MPRFIYYCKKIFTYFMIELFISINWKDEIYNLILIIINQLIKIIYYKSIKITINSFELTKDIFDMVV